MDWIQTYSGKAAHLLNPVPSEIDIEDIAHALSMICRFTGHVHTFYSVAQHSVLVAELLPESMQLQGLLHDGHEAFIGDISSPLKRTLKDNGAREVCHQLQEGFDFAIYRALGIPLPTRTTKQAIHDADLAMLMAERRDLMKPARPFKAWNAELEALTPAPNLIEPWSQADAKAEFLRLFHAWRSRDTMRHDFLAH